MSTQLLQARERLEAKIEELIAMLDLLDGDPDLEPYLTNTRGPTGGSADDREGDDSDSEPSLGWPNASGLPQLSSAMRHDEDLEEDGSDYEDGGDTEPNGDELDTSFTEDDGGAGLWH